MMSKRWRRGLLGVAMGSAFLTGPMVATSQEIPTKRELEERSWEEVAQPRQLSMNDAIAMAQWQSNQVRIGQIDLQKADLALDEVRAGRIPTVTLEGQYTNNIQTPAMVLPENSPFGGGLLRTGSRHNSSGTVQVSVPVFSAELNRSIELSQVMVNLEEMLQEATSEEVALEVRRAYLNALLSQELETILLASYEALERNYEYVRGMYRAGTLPEYDMIRTEVQVRNLEPEITAARNNVEGSKNYLKLLIGLGLDEEIRLVGTMEEIYGEVAPFYDTDNFEANRDLVQLRGQASVLDAQRALEEASYLPRVAAFGSFAYQGAGDDLAVWDHQWYGTGMVGLTVSIPLIEGGRRQRIEQVRLEQIQLRMQRDFVLKSLQSQYQTTRERIAMLEESIEAQERNVAQAQRGYEIARVSYEAGVHSLIDVNDAESALRDARRNYTTTLADYLNARFDMMELLGTSGVPQEDGNEDEMDEDPVSEVGVEERANDE